MTQIFATPAMLALDALMVAYTVWVLSLNARTRAGRITITPRAGGPGGVK